MSYNPMIDYQRNQLLAQQAMINNQLNQLNQMNYMQPNAAFPPHPQQNNQPQFVVRQVGSIDEAKGFPADPNTMYFFLDTSEGKIYMKQLNLTNGKSEFFKYVLQEDACDKNAVDPMEEIRQKLISIENKLGGLYDNKPISSITSCEKPNAGDTGADNDSFSQSKSAAFSAGSKHGERKK